MVITNSVHKQRFEGVAEEIAPDVVRVTGQMFVDYHDVKIHCQFDVIRQIDGESEYVLVVNNDAVFVDAMGKYYCYNVSVRSKNELLGQSDQRVGPLIPREVGEHNLFVQEENFGE